MIVIYGADSAMVSRMLNNFDCVAVGRARQTVREAAE